MRNLIWVMALAGAAFGQSGMDGNWQGTLDAGANKLRVGLHVSKNEKGEWKSTFDSLDQDAMGLPVAVTTVSGQALHFEMPAIHASFDGKLSLDGKQISGIFTQGGTIPLVLSRIAGVAAPVNRPQMPKGPFPYDAVEVSYENKLGKLAGTLTIPQGKGPFPAAIMITGSGPQNRDEELFGHKPILGNRRLSVAAWCCGAACRRPGSGRVSGKFA